MTLWLSTLEQKSSSYKTIGARLPIELYVWYVSAISSPFCLAFYYPRLGKILFPNYLIKSSFLTSTKSEIYLGIYISLVKKEFFIFFVVIQENFQSEIQ